MMFCAPFHFVVSRETGRSTHPVNSESTQLSFLDAYTPSAISPQDYSGQKLELQLRAVGRWPPQVAPPIPRLGFRVVWFYNVLSVILDYSVRKDPS